MPKREITYDEVLHFLNNLPYNKFKEIVEHYSVHTNADFEKELDIMVTLNLQERLKLIGVNSCCPKCNSARINKCGKRNFVQLFKCKECNSKFTLFTGSILEKTKWHWDIWIRVLEMTLNNYSLHSMINVLTQDYGCKGINYKTVWLWRMKLIHALASFPMPKLSGVIQVDETFIRESQKGSRRLVSYLDKQDIRTARYGRQPSKFGVMGPEFATVTAAIDNTGYCVCKVSGLGKLTKEIFTDLFEEHLDNPSYICSDANPVYREYCELFNIPHYERPSKYHTVITKAGYQTPDRTNPSELQETIKRNEEIRSRLYNEELIDKVTNKGQMSYEEFKELKEQNGLNLGRVNGLHSEIKKFINIEKRNVATKYLQDYIGFFAFKWNWNVDNGHYPTSRKDAEKIFVEVLKAKVNLTATAINEKQLDLPKPSSRYITLLKQETEKVRMVTSNDYFKFDEEDGFKKFNKREYLLDQPKSKLLAIGKECKLKKYRKLSTWSIVNLILKQKNIDEIIYKLLLQDRHYKMSKEDVDKLLADEFKVKNISS
jgi:transposase-like protein